MSFLGNNELKQLLPSLVKENFEPNNIKNACYNLRLGTEVYVTNSKRKKKELLNDKNPQTRIEPGQFALLITSEKLNMPENLIGFISLRFSLKRRGLVNVSGFHIDPGFSGKIVFSVYNAGPATIFLEKDQSYFSMWLSQVTSNSNYDGQFENQSSISASYLNDLNGDLPYPGTLLKRIKKNENRTIYVLTFGGIIIAVLLAALGYYFTQNSKFKDGIDYRSREQEFSRFMDSVRSSKQTQKELKDSTR